MKVILTIVLSFFIMSGASASLEEIFGNAENGDSCVSDYECGSLCCSSSSNLCAPHDPSGNKPVLCNKESGQRCISTEFCKSYDVTTCKLVKNGQHADGSISCSIRCLPVKTASQCVDGYCRAPLTPPMPSWDGKDCSNAVDP